MTQIPLITHEANNDLAFKNENLVNYTKLPILHDVERILRNENKESESNFVNEENRALPFPPYVLSEALVSSLCNGNNKNTVNSLNVLNSINPSNHRLNKFVRRLHDMLANENGSGIVEWRKGLLILHSTAIFTKKILPVYFNTRNFKTFRRQLNYYGFVHIRSYTTTSFHSLNSNVRRNDGPSDVSSTTALWVNQYLAKHGTNDISSILSLKRVDPCGRAPETKTSEGRRVRKEEAILSVAQSGSSCGKEESCTYYKDLISMNCSSIFFSASAGPMKADTSEIKEPKNICPISKSQPDLFIENKPIETSNSIPLTSKALHPRPRLVSLTSSPASSFSESSSCSHILQKGASSLNHRFQSVTQTDPSSTHLTTYNHGQNTLISHSSPAESSCLDPEVPQLVGSSDAAKILLSLSKSSCCY